MFQWKKLRKSLPNAYKWKKMIFGKEIKGRKIKFLNLISKCFNGKDKGKKLLNRLFPAKY